MRKLLLTLILATGCLADDLTDRALSEPDCDFKDVPDYDDHPAGYDKDFYWLRAQGWPRDNRDNLSSSKSSVKIATSENTTYHELTDPSLGYFPKILKPKDEGLIKAFALVSADEVDDAGWYKLRVKAVSKDGEDVCVTKSSTIWVDD